MNGWEMFLATILGGLAWLFAELLRLWLERLLSPVLEDIRR